MQISTFQIWERARAALQPRFDWTVHGSDIMVAMLTFRDERWKRFCFEIDFFTINRIHFKLTKLQVR